jgi:hypothetical protein
MGRKSQLPVSKSNCSGYIDPTPLPFRLDVRVSDHLSEFSLNASLFRLVMYMGRQVITFETDMIVPSDVIRGPTYAVENKI